MGNDGPTHHGSFVGVSGMHANLVIMAPAEEVDLINMVATAAIDDKPSVVRYQLHGLRPEN